jgi:hypothetical protein
MRLQPDYISAIVTFITVLPAVIAIPLPRHYQSSTFHQALEAMARFVTEKAENEFNSSKTLDFVDYALLEILAY